MRSSLSFLLSAALLAACIATTPSTSGDTSDETSSESAATDDSASGSTTGSGSGSGSGSTTGSGSGSTTDSGSSSGSSGSGSSGSSSGNTDVDPDDPCKGRCSEEQACIIPKGAKEGDCRTPCNPDGSGSECTTGTKCTKYGTNEDGSSKGACLPPTDKCGGKCTSDQLCLSKDEVTYSCFDTCTTEGSNAGCPSGTSCKAAGDDLVCVPTGCNGGCAANERCLATDEAGKTTECFRQCSTDDDCNDGETCDTVKIGDEETKLCFGN